MRVDRITKCIVVVGGDQTEINDIAGWHQKSMQEASNLLFARLHTGARLPVATNLAASLVNSACATMTAMTKTSNVDHASIT